MDDFGFWVAVVGAIMCLVGIWLEVRHRIPGRTQIRPDQVEDDDPLLREVAARAWNTGKPVVGYVDDEGKLVVEEKE